jgi:hypothetical protein
LNKLINEHISKDTVSHISLWEYENIISLDCGCPLRSSARKHALGIERKCKKSHALVVENKCKKSCFSHELKISIFKPFKLNKICLNILVINGINCHLKNIGKYYSLFLTEIILPFMK